MKEVHVVGAAIKDGSKILAAQRSAYMSMPLKWEFVGGKLEAGESHEQALKREVMEELGVKIEVGRFLASGISEEEERRIILHVYEAHLVEGVPYPHEHAQLEWVEIDSIRELDWAKADIPACDVLVRLYGEN